MKNVREWLQRHARSLVAFGLIVVFYWQARLPTLSASERVGRSARFHFTQTELPEVEGYPVRNIRDVHPDFQHIQSWISSVGASVALNDLDGDGLPNDVCYVDTRTNQVIVAPAPGTPQRYKPFVLDPAPLPFDPNTMAPMGVLPGDYNEDGRMDILVYYWGRSPILFLRRGDDSLDHPVSLSRDKYVARELVSPVQPWNTNAATTADLDGDGHVDIVIGNYFPDGERVLDAHATDHAVMQHSMSRSFNGGSKHFLLWTGASEGSDPQAHFRDADPGLPSEAAHGWTLAIGAADLDGDLLPEIYLANDFGPDRLLHNLSTPGHLRFALLEGRKTLTTPSSKVLGRDSFKGMGVDFGDIYGNGLLDIYVSNIATNYALEESHFVFVNTGDTGLMKQGTAPFVDRSEELGLSRSGWAWDCKLADFDNEGALEALQATGFVKGEINRWPELHELAMSNDTFLHSPSSWPRFRPGDDLNGHQHCPFFVRAADGRYYDLAPEIGLNQPHVARGIAIADVDGDGKLDFAMANQWESSIFYHNDSPAVGAFLGLHLRLPLHVGQAAQTFDRPGHPGPDTPSRPAIGAAATLHLPDGRRFTAQVDGGNGHSGKRSPDIHFGLGALPANTPLTVDLAWRDPSGHVHRERRGR